MNAETGLFAIVAVLSKQLAATVETTRRPDGYVVKLTVPLRAPKQGKTQMTPTNECPAVNVQRH